VVEKRVENFVGLVIRISRFGLNYADKLHRIPKDKTRSRNINFRLDILEE